MSVRRLVCLGAAAAMLTGCVERRIAITSEPPGALVRLNDVEVGRTPLETNFLYHGVYDVQVELEGYEPLMTERAADAPWWEYPPFDLAAELVPARLDNTIRWHFDLEPVPERTQAPAEFEADLLERARSLREQADD